MRAPFFLGLLTLPAVLTLNAAPAAADLAGVELRLLASGLSDPVAIAQAGDDRLFIVEQRGRIRIFTGGAVQPGSFLDLSARVRSGNITAAVAELLNHAFDGVDVEAGAGGELERRPGACRPGERGGAAGDSAALRQPQRR